ncbi:unnamed protein product [Adineta steineri]|uniref:Uncharacterized protein n=2 Tax=Adineta steineri TaxID=433720 RepID=A0A814JVY4_9BILA|nr:unnamed protein product [Adineta steineri]
MGQYISISSSIKTTRSNSISPIDYEFNSPRFTVNDAEQIQQGIEHLNEHGYAVFSNVLSPNEITLNIDLLWEHFESLLPPYFIKRDDAKTWDDAWPGIPEFGILSDDGFGHSQFIWSIRGNPNVKKIFTEIWKTPELLVSFDAAGCFRDWRINPSWKTVSGWYHCDQNPMEKSNRCSIQGFVSLTDNDESTGGLVVVPQSHKHFDELRSIADKNNAVMITQNPSSAAIILAANIPTASNFFFSFLALQGLTMAPSLLLQIATLILFYLLGKLFDNTPRKKWKRYFTLSSLNWGTIFPVFTNFIVITLVYSIIAPLMLLISGLAFGLFYIAYAYTMFYVTDFPNDAGGLAFPRAIYQSFTGIYLMEIMLATLFFLAQNDSGSQSAIVEAIFMCVSIAITVAVQYTMCTSFDPLTYYLPIDAEEFSQLDIPVSGKFGITKKVTRILNHRQSINDSDSVSTADQAVNEVYDNTMENAYLHPALRDPKPIIWIPCDNLGIAVDEVQKTEASGMNILMSTEGARFNDKINIEINGAPPDHMPFTETNQVRTRF